jgi:ankyrin repeat protein
MPKDLVNKIGNSNPPPVRVNKPSDTTKPQFKDPNDVGALLNRVTANIQQTVKPEMLSEVQKFQRPGVLIYLEEDAGLEKKAAEAFMAGNIDLAKEKTDERALLKSQTIAKLYRDIVSQEVASFRKFGLAGNFTRTLENIAWDYAKADAATQEKILNEHFKNPGNPNVKEKLQAYGDFLIAQDIFPFTGDMVLSQKMTNEIDEMGIDAAVLFFSSILATLVVPETGGTSALPWYTINAPILARFAKFVPALYLSVTGFDYSLGRSHKPGLSAEGLLEMAGLCATMGITGTVGKASYQGVLKTYLKNRPGNKWTATQIEKLATRLSEKIELLKNMKLGFVDTLQILMLSGMGVVFSDGDMVDQIEHNIIFFAMLKLGGKATQVLTSGRRSFKPTQAENDKKDISAKAETLTKELDAEIAKPTISQEIKNSLMALNAGLKALIARFRKEKSVDKTELSSAEKAKIQSEFVNAIEGNDIARVKDLIARGADVNAKGKDGQSYLHEAASKGHVEIVKLLIEKGADINARNKYGNSALHYAAFENIEIVKILIEKGANVNVEDNAGKTPLRDAIKFREPEIAKFLIEKGADVNANNGMATTILFDAIHWHLPEIARLMIEKGADVKAANADVITPLYQAVLLEQTEIVKLLIERGADANAKTNEGKTVLAVAKNGTYIIVLMAQSTCVETKQWQTLKKSIPQKLERPLFNVLFEYRELFSTEKGEAENKKLNEPLMNFLIGMVQKHKFKTPSLLPEIFEAAKKGLIPKRFFEDPAALVKIDEFIKQFHQFDSGLFEIYQKSSNPVKMVEALKLIQTDILSGELNVKNFNEYYDKHKIIFENMDPFKLLKVVISFTMPASKSSWLKDREDSILKYGVDSNRDYGLDIKPEWKGKVFKDSLLGNEREYVGEKDIHLERFKTNLNDYLELQKSQKAEQKLKSHAEQENKIIQDFANYLKLDRKTTAHEAESLTLFESFLKWSSHEQGEYLDGFKNTRNDYLRWSVLEEMMNDKDALPRFLNKITAILVEQKQFERFALQNLPQIKTETSKKLVYQLKKISQAEGDNASKKRAMAQMLCNFDWETTIGFVKDLQNKGELPKAFSIEMKDLREAHFYLKVDQFFKVGRKKIQAELNKYKLANGGESKNLEYRVVKGLPQILYGKVAGVCTGTDTKLWEDSKFKVMQMNDPDTGKVVGYIQIYEAEHNGKKYLTIPGIEPSTEYVSENSPKPLYESMIKAIKHFAKLGGYADFYIPTNAGIHSNRPEIQKQILEHAKGYESTSLPFTVDWAV